MLECLLIGLGVWTLAGCVHFYRSFPGGYREPWWEKVLLTPALLLICAIALISQFIDLSRRK